jgi:REP element-mobilizing transposase RayT
MNRGLSRAPIFDIDNDYGMFMEALKESLALFEVELYSYCLMTNHYHLLLHTPKGNLSRFMRHLSAVYTQRFNRLHKKDGPIFRGRYKAILVQEDAYLMHLVRYIHLNPIQANLVQDLTSYPWSSHNRYLKAQDEHWLCVTKPLSFFSNSPIKTRRAYLDFIKDGIDPKTKAFFSFKKQNPIFGEDDFIDKIKNEFLSNNKKTEEISQVRPILGNLILARIDREVAKNFKVSQDQLCCSERGKHNRPRSVAIALARELSGLGLQEMANHYKLGSYKTVSAHHRRLTKTMSGDKKLSGEYERLRIVISK